MKGKGDNIEFAKSNKFYWKASSFKQLCECINGFSGALCVDYTDHNKWKDHFVKKISIRLDYLKSNT